MLISYNCFQSENKHETEQYEEPEPAIVGQSPQSMIAYDTHIGDLKVTVTVETDPTIADSRSPFGLFSRLFSLWKRF